MELSAWNVPHKAHMTQPMNTEQYAIENHRFQCAISVDLWWSRQLRLLQIVVLLFSLWKMCEGIEERHSYDGRPWNTMHLKSSGSVVAQTHFHFILFDFHFSSVYLFDSFWNGVVWCFILFVCLRFITFCQCMCVCVCVGVSSNKYEKILKSSLKRALDVEWRSHSIG